MTGAPPSPSETPPPADFPALDKVWGLGPSLSVVPVTGGRVNRTFRVDSPQGAFALQQLHPIFGSDGAVVENVRRATACLQRRDFPTPLLRPALDGRWWIGDGGRVWRLMTWVPGRPATERNRSTVSGAADWLGRFHRILAESPLGLKPLPPGEHNRDKPSGSGAWFGLLELARSRENAGGAAAAVESGRELAARTGDVPSRTRCVVHGDPKLENFLVDGQERTVGLIDLDTIREGWLIWELADALRSWAGLRDRQDVVHLDAALFGQAVAAYRTTGLDMADDEWAALPRATAAMALNLARRYLQDHFDQAYFAWDRSRYPSLAEQNLSRGRGLLALAGELLALF